MKLKAYVDRIEDGKTAVVIVDRYGRLLIPVKDFKSAVHEGQHFSLDLTPEPGSEASALRAVESLQKKLLKKSGGR